MPGRSQSRRLWLVVVGMLLVIACSLFPFLSRSPEGQGVEAALSPAPRGDTKVLPGFHNVRLPDYTFYLVGQRTPFEVLLGPFPFQIRVQWQPLAENVSTPWNILVVNADDNPHVLQAIEVQGSLAALTFKGIMPSLEPREVMTTDGTKAKRFSYALRLESGDQKNLQIEVTTYLGMSVRGVMVFCADEIAVGRCMALPMEVPVR